MNRSRVSRFALVAAGVVGLALLAPAVGAAPGTGAPTFQEFKASTYRDTDGQYIVNGDEPVRGTGALRAFYQRMVGAPQKISEAGLIVNTVAGRDDRWSAAQVGSLTYCISNKFGSRKAAVARATAQGARLWERASSAIDYSRVRSAEASCTVRNDAVVFSVEPTMTQRFIARSFFPSSPDRLRNVKVNPISMSSNPNIPPANILGHELGHILGFRHEHTRPEAGGLCFEDLNWRPLTPYDSASIMHYPQCNGTSRDLSFTDTDAEGVVALYGR